MDLARESRKGKDTVCLDIDQEVQVMLISDIGTQEVYNYGSSKLECHILVRSWVDEVKVFNAIQSHTNRVIDGSDVSEIWSATVYLSPVIVLDLCC